MKNTLEGKNVLITGGTKGVGLATAKLLASKKANVFIFSRHQEGLDSALLEIEKASGHKAFGMVADATNHEDLKNIFSTIDAKLGTLDILINNASLGARSVLDHTPEEIRYFLEVNLDGYLVCSRLALQRMLPKKSGHIINIGSMSAHLFDQYSDVYVAAKGGVAAFSESLRKKVNRFSVKVSLIESGSIATSMIDESEREKQELISEEKFLKPEDLAEVILFILERPSRSEIMKVQLKPNQQFF